MHRWTRLSGNLRDVAEIAQTVDRSWMYHNWNHVGRGYAHADRFGFPYDVNLDVAWMFHDYVYDEKPDKELRSIERFHQLYATEGPIDGVDSDKVESLIRSSIDHKVVDDERLILMDLGDFYDPAQVMENYVSIHHESNKLYGTITDQEYAQKTAEFMRSMVANVERNFDQSVERKKDWQDIIDGINGLISHTNKTLDK